MTAIPVSEIGTGVLGEPTVEQSATAPLTFGQMSVWRDIDKLPRDRWHEANISHNFRLPRAVSRTELSRALTRLYAKHESLRTVYDTADPQQPRQRLLPPSAAVEAEVAYCAERDVPDLIASLADRSFDLTRDRPLRVLAVADVGRSADPDEPCLDQILLCAHHIACDGWSLGLLSMDLIALLGLGGDQLPPPENSLCSIAEEQRSSPTWQRKLKATQRHFREVYETGRADFRTRDANAETLQVSVVSREVFSAAHAIAESFKVSVASVFTAAFIDGVGNYCDAGAVRFGLMSSNRFRQRWYPLVTTMNQLIPIDITADSHSAFGERVAAVQVSAMRAYQLGLFDVDQVTPAALGLSRPLSELRPICTVNVVDGATPAMVGEAAGGTPELEWEPVFSHISAGCYLRVYISAEGAVRLRLRTGGLPAETVGGILLATHQRIIDGAAEPVRTVQADAVAVMPGG